MLWWWIDNTKRWSKYEAVVESEGLMLHFAANVFGNYSGYRVEVRPQRRHSAPSSFFTFTSVLLTRPCNNFNSHLQSIAKQLN